MTVALSSNETKRNNLSSGSQWRADLSLNLANTKRGTRLVESRHCGPLYVQKAFYPEGDSLAHIYLLHPPGGIVSGDTLSIDVHLQKSSRALFTTPGAGRVYRVRPDRSLQQQKVCLQLAENASAEWFPLETLAYPDAFAKLTTRVEMARGSCFVGWDICCLGLPASGKSFDRGEIRQRFEIVKEGKLQLIDNLNVNATDKQLVNAKAGLQSHTVNGFFVAGPFNLSVDHSALLEPLRSINTSKSFLFASTLVGEFMIIRYLGDSAARARQFYIECWRYIRPVLLGRKVCCPRIWNT